MKRNIFALIFFFALFITGCSVSLHGIVSMLPWDVPDKFQSFALPDSLSKPAAAEAAVGFSMREYGEPCEIIDNSDFLHCYLLYPKTGLPEIDRLIYSWADSVYSEAKENISSVHESDPSAVGEINAQYNACLVGGAYASIKEVGFYTHSQMDTPINFLKVFNVDLEQGRLLRNEEIIDPSHAGTALKLLVEQALIRYPELAGTLALAGASLLDDIALSHDGVEVILEKGEFLPERFGLQTFTLTYESLGDALALGDAADAGSVANAPAMTDSANLASASSAPQLGGAPASAPPPSARNRGASASASSTGQPAQIQDATAAVPPRPARAQGNMPPAGPPPSQGQAPYMGSAPPGAQWQTPPAGSPPALGQASPAGYASPQALGQTPAAISHSAVWIDPEKPMIALTFDDGPSKVTPRILELLEQYGGRATFCVLGARVNGYADIIRQAAAQGSQIIGHSWDHKQLTRLSADEIRTEISSTNKAIYDITGIMPTMYRPPYGSVNGTVSNISQEIGMAIINWSVDPVDWKTRKANAIYNAIMSRANDGGIILCHDLYGATADAMERVIPELTAQGYQLVTLSELFSFSEEPLVAGIVYRRR